MGLSAALLRPAGGGHEMPIIIIIIINIEGVKITFTSMDLYRESALIQVERTKLSLTD